MPSIYKRSERHGAIRVLACFFAVFLIFSPLIPTAHAETGVLGFILHDEFGQSVDGVGLQLLKNGTNGQGVVVSTTRSDANGYVRLAGIDPGSYTLTFVPGSIPPILAQDNQGTFNFRVETSGNLVYDRNPSDALMARRARHEATYQMYDSNGTAISVDGAVFNVVSTDPNINLIQNFTVSGGSLTLALPTGSYRMTNEMSPQGYERIDGSISFTIDAQGNYRFSKNPSDAFRFGIAKGNFTFTKVDDDGQPVSGALFKLAGEGLNTTALSSATGIVSFSGLIQETNGQSYTYILTEATAPSGYARSNASVTVNVDASGNVTFSEDPATVFVNKRQAFTFSFIKKNDAGTPLSGAVFTLTGENNSGSYTATSEVLTGRVIFRDIPHGIYSLTETTAAEGYSASTKKINVIISQDGEITYTEDAAKAFVSDRSRFSFSFTAKAEDGAVLPGAVYHLKGTQSANATATLDGKVTFRELLAGKYTLTQTDVPTGYTRSKESVTVTVAEDGTITYSDTIEAHVVATIARYTVGFDKRNDAGEPVRGAVFRLTGTAYDKEAASDENGRVTFTGLLGGEYTLAETSAPDGYAKVTETVTVTVSSSGIVSYDREPREIFINTRSIHRFEFTVTDETGAPLQDAAFTLTRAGSTPIESVSRKNGKVLYEKIPFGTYILEQKSAPLSYTKSPVRVQVDIEPDGEISYREIVAQPKPLVDPMDQMEQPDPEAQTEETQLIFLPSLEGVFVNMTGPLSFSFRVVNDDMEPISDAAFRLTNQETGELRGTRSKNGVAIYYNLEPGEYELTQTEAPAYYEAEADSYRIKIENGGQVTVWKLPSITNNEAEAVPESDETAEAAEPEEADDPLPEIDLTLPIYEDNLPNGETKNISAISFMNKREKFSIQIRAAEPETEEPAAGAIFSLSREPGGERIDLIVTGDDGIGRSMRLSPGDYYLKVQTTPSGFDIVIPDGELYIHLSENGEPSEVFIEAQFAAEPVAAEPVGLVDQAVDFVRNNVPGVAMGGIGALLLAALLFLILK